MTQRRCNPRCGDAHKGYQTAVPASQDHVSMAVDPAREADREGCPHYPECLARAALAERSARAPSDRCVCRPGCNGTPRPTLEQIVDDCASECGTKSAAVRGSAKWTEACQARNLVWERGNLLGYTDLELARATGVTRQTVGMWLDQPRSRK